MLGLLSRPALDGAVRVVIERDTEGKATSVKRLDASGKAITSPAPDPHADMTK